MPKCDFCSQDAIYDAKTKYGPWANLCESHFKQHGIKLGTGFGQRLQPSIDRKKLASECFRYLSMILSHPDATADSAMTQYSHIGTDNMTDQQLIEHHAELQKIYQKFWPEKSKVGGRVMPDIYVEKSYKDRNDYLRSLADEYGVDKQIVFYLAEILGPNEDFDGLISALEDTEEMGDLLE